MFLLPLRNCDDVDATEVITIKIVIIIIILIIIFIIIIVIIYAVDEVDGPW